MVIVDQIFAVFGFFCSVVASGGTSDAIARIRGVAVFLAPTVRPTSAGPSLGGTRRNETKKNDDITAAVARSLYVVAGGVSVWLYDFQAWVAKVHPAHHTLEIVDGVSYSKVAPVEFYRLVCPFAPSYLPRLPPVLSLPPCAPYCSLWCVPCGPKSFKVPKYPRRHLLQGTTSNCALSSWAWTNWCTICVQMCIILNITDVMFRGPVA